ncbi:MAG: hypothetical protein NT070_15075 [Cyanobacteria bacterium]|nr:hypothetical protein [Cyanobacteriota bacterium]
MTQVNKSGDLLQQAHSGDLAAIQQLMMQTFQDQGIRVQISQNANELKIFLEAKSLPNQVSTIDILQRGMRDLKCSTIDILKILACSPGSPEQQWSEEVFLKVQDNQNLAQKLVNQEQVSKLMDRSLKKTQALAETSKDALEALPFKRIAQIAGVGALILGVGTGSILGVKTGLTFWQHRQILAQADQAITESSNQEALKSSEAIQTSQTSLNTTKAKLVKLSTVFGSTGKEAEAKLTKIDQQLNALTQRLSQENSGSDVLSEANQVITNNHQLLETQPHPLVKWKRAQEQIKQVTKQLKAIPAETAVSTTAKKSLSKIKEQETNISKAILIEEKAFQVLLLANKIAQRAFDVTNPEKNIGLQANLENLQKAQSLWQQATEQLKKVPPQKRNFFPN